MGWLGRNTRYEKVNTTESTDDLSPASLPPRSCRRILAHLNTLFFLVNLVFFSTLVWTARHIDSPNYLLRKTNTYTPLLKQFDLSLVRTKNNASLFNTPYSIYKDSPSPEVDAAWEAIADTPVLAISREDVIAMGKDVDYVVGIPEEFGHGADKYFAVNDGQHLIHCLNELRKFAFYDHYYEPKYGASKGLPGLVAAHRSHCLGVLLDALTCQPSLNMVVWEYMEGQSTPWPDFDAWRMCYGHERFYEWQKGVQVDIDMSKDWDWTKGRTKERPEPEELRRERLKGGGEQHGGSHAGHGGHWS